MNLAHKSNQIALFKPIFGCLCYLMDHRKNKRERRIYREQQIRLYMTGFIIPFIYKNIY